MFAAVVLLTGCDGDVPPAATQGTSAPSPGPYADTTPPAIDSGDADFASFLGLRGPKPPEWTTQPPQSPMHHAAFVVPGADGGEPAQVVVFANIGGSIEANIARWQGQFRSPDGRDVQPQVQRLDAGEMQVTLVELEGDYMGVGMRWYERDQQFIMAIVDTPAPHEQRLFIRMVGDRATVLAHREAFIAMIEGLEPID